MLRKKVRQNLKLSYSYLWNSSSTKNYIWSNYFCNFFASSYSNKMHWGRGCYFWTDEYWLWTNVGSTLFQRCVSTLWISVEMTLIRGWKWSKIWRRIFNVAQRWYNVVVRRWNNVETTLIQLYLDVASACSQH